MKRMSAWLILFFLFSFVQKVTADVFVYDRIVEGTHLQTTWKIEPKEQVIFMEGKNPETTTTLECNSEFQLQKYSRCSDKLKSEHHIFRKGDQLTIIKKTNGKIAQEEYKIGKSHWNQEFLFTLKPFIKSKETLYKFCIIDPKDLALRKMEATKEKIENVTVEGKEYKAQKIKITLQGFQKRFWKAEVWYNPDTGNLLMYRANEGPATPMTTIAFLSAD